MRRTYFVVLVLCAAPALFGQQPNSLPSLKYEAVKEVDALQTLTQQMVDEIFSFSELGFQEFETSHYVPGFWRKTASTSNAALPEFLRLGSQAMGAANR